MRSRVREKKGEGGKREREREALVTNRLLSFNHIKKPLKVVMSNRFQSSLLLSQRQLFIFREREREGEKENKKEEGRKKQ